MPSFWWCMVLLVAGYIYGWKEGREAMAKEERDDES
jgi:hypothetical protein